MRRHVVGDGLPGVLRAAAAASPLAGFLVGAEAALQDPRPGRIVRAAPAVLAVLPVPERPEGLFPSRRRDVQALARLQIDPRREHVDVDAAFRVPVLNGAPDVPVRLQPGPGGFLELLQHFPDLPVRRVVLRSPGDHPGGALVRELQGVGHGLDLGRIADQNLDALPLPALGVLLSGQVLRRSSSPAAEANHHRSAPPAGERSDLPPQGEQVGDDLHRFRPLLVGVHPARDLVQVVSDPR